MGTFSTQSVLPFQYFESFLTCTQHCYTYFCIYF